MSSETKKKARERRQRRNAKRKRNAQPSERLQGWEHVKLAAKHVQVAKALTALLGDAQSAAFFVFVSKRRPDAKGRVSKGRTYRNPFEKSRQVAHKASKRPKGMSKAEWKHDRRQARITRYLATAGLRKAA